MFILRPPRPRVPSTVRVRFFATAREASGVASQPWPVPPEGLPTRLLVEQLVRRYPALGPIVRHSRFVRNGEYVERPTEPVRPGDEFAIHPPYSGG